jgi:5-methylthioadenosine/S-adenosylhomocysteine deaminase
MPEPDIDATLILHDVVHDGQRCDVIVTGSRISAIQPITTAHQERPLPWPGQTAARVIDGGGRMAIVPPFYNAHTHSAMTLLRGYADDLELGTWLTQHIWPAEARLEEPDIRAGSRLAILEMIKSGTVFFNDMYWDQVATVAAVTELGVRASIGLLYFTDPAGVISPRCARANGRLMERASDLPDRIEISHAPHAVYTVAAPVLADIAARAADTGARIHIHASETAGEVADCLATTGLTPIGLMDRVGLLGPRTVLAHCVHLTADDLATIVERGSVIAHMPISNMKLCAGTFDLPGAQAAGARIALGTDGASSNNGLSMLDEMKFASLSAKRLSGSATAGRADDILGIATYGGADAFDIDAGRIAVGKLADAILVDLDHPSMIADHDLAANLVYAADSAVVDTVICNGRVLMTGRRVPGEADIVAEAREAAARVRAGRG